MDMLDNKSPKENRKNEPVRRNFREYLCSRDAHKNDMIPENTRQMEWITPIILTPTDNPLAISRASGPKIENAVHPERFIKRITTKV